MSGTSIVRAHLDAVAIFHTDPVNTLSNLCDDLGIHGNLRASVFTAYYGSGDDLPFAAAIALDYARHGAPAA